MSPLHQTLTDHLHAWLDAPVWLVALSGGLDSVVLLDLLSELRPQRPLPPVQAIHVHHGLQPAADDWVRFCQQFCAARAVPLTVIRVQVDTGASLERAAREARYHALAQQLPRGAVLLTAQHQDDQAETLLLRLLRGAGVPGLAAMPASRPLGEGQLVRPLLDCTRAQLEQYAHARGLAWVEDPSNADTRLRRNFLRHAVLPRLREHWPATSRVLARAAQQQAEAAGLLAELALQDLAAARVDPAPGWLALPQLDLQVLRSLSEARQRNALRHWLAYFTRLPDTVHWAGWQALRDAREDGQPRWSLESGVLQRHGSRLYWLSGDWLQAPQAQYWRDGEEPLPLVGNGRVWIAGARPPGILQIRYRAGGEQLQIDGRGRRDLKRLLQEAGLPAFVRQRLPLLYAGDELLAVANLPQLSRQAGVQLRWQPPSAG